LGDFAFLEGLRVPDYLSFHLSEHFLATFEDLTPKWGFPAGAGNTLGEYSWLTKYSRRKEDGTRERFWEGLARVINGMYSIQKDYALHQKLPWNEQQAQVSACEAYWRAFEGKWGPPGRGLWMMGTEMVNGKRDSSALQNCAFVSTADLEKNPTLPFTRLMDMSMLGVGVGFDTLGAGKVTIHDPRGVYPHKVGDSREGWADSLGSLLRAYFCGSRLPNFDYSGVRPAGAAIKGFGGIASGPDPLRKLHHHIVRLFEGRAGGTLESSDIVDIMNMAGKCVVSANVRRSAEIALGQYDDEAFLDLKDWNVNPERMGADGWGHLSNNSVLATSGTDYSGIASRIAVNGEPGIFWQDIAQNYGRLSDPADYKEYRTKGVNPCGEQPLEPYELCTLVETFPTNCDGLQDYLRTLKFAYLYGKTVTLLMTRWPETNEVMIRNRRIGTSMTGIAQFAETHGWYELRKWQDKGYEEIRRWDGIYSEWLGVRESIRVSTVKPSGTVSLLHGVTPGAHWPKERGFYVRTVRDIKGSPIAKAMSDAGYLVEPSVADPDTTVVIYLPVEGPDIRPEREVSVWEKASLAATCQRMWSDNAVSVTLTFREDEKAQVPAVLRAFDGQLKSVSFLPMAEGIYQQAPYQRVEKQTWDRMRAKIKPIDWDALYASEDLPEAEGELYCTTDICEMPR
jgi:ribonucleoside-triphosphate reductase